MKIQKAVNKEPEFEVLKVESFDELEKFDRENSLGLIRHDDGSFRTSNYIDVEEGDWLILDRTDDGRFYFVDTVYPDEVFNKYMELAGE